MWTKWQGRDISGSKLRNLRTPSKLNLPNIYLCLSRNRETCQWKRLQITCTIYWLDNTYLSDPKLFHMFWQIHWKCMGSHTFLGNSLMSTYLIMKLFEFKYFALVYELYSLPLHNKPNVMQFISNYFQESSL